MAEMDDQQRTMPEPSVIANAQIRILLKLSRADANYVAMVAQNQHISRRQVNNRMPNVD